MSSPVRRTALGALLAAVTACAPNPAPSSAPLPADAAARITLLHINDVYEITPVEGGKSGGLARVATVLARLRSLNPNTRMFLAGDFVSPSAIGTARVGGERLGGRQMVAVLNAVGLDLATLGNHEFDLSEAELGRRVAESRFAYVSTNVTDSLGAPLFRIPRHLIIRFPAGGGREVRLGVVAATIAQVRKPNLRYQQPVAALRREIALIRDSVDALVALTHLALNDDVMLVDSIPSLDLVLGGHEHENWSIRRGERFTWILKADANVRSVAIVNLTVRPPDRPGITWQLLPITDSIPEAPAVAAEASRWTGLAFAAFRQDGLHPEQRVALLPGALDAREQVIRRGENSLTRLLTAALRAEAPEADLALLNTGSVRLDDVLPAGPLTEYDVIRLLPFGGKAVVVEMTGALLQRTLEQGEANQGNGGFLARDGAEHTPDGWRVGTALLDPAKHYRVVTTDFLVTGGEQNMAWLSPRNPELTVGRTLRDVRLVVIDELRRRYPPG